MMVKVGCKVDCLAIIYEFLLNFVDKTLTFNAPSLIWTCAGHCGQTDEAFNAMELCASLRKKWCLSFNEHTKQPSLDLVTTKLSRERGQCGFAPPLHSMGVVQFR